MKMVLLAAVLAGIHARADLIIVQKVEGMGQSGEMTLKIHGDNLRADVSPQISVIRDLKSGDSITLMHAQKTFMRISGAAAEALRQRVAKQLPTPEDSPSPSASPKLLATGKKDKINSFDVEEYSAEAGAMKVHYWIAKNYPDWAAIQGEVVKISQKGLDQLMKGHAPSASDLPGMPLRTDAEVNGQKLITTIISTKAESINAAQFQVPPDYKEMATPSFGDEAAAPAKP
jgi:hypothetical protein